MLIRLGFAAFLLAHALIHIAFVAPAPPATAGGPAWPFSTGESWFLTRFGVGSDAARIVALALVAATIAGFALAALSLVGFAPAGIWLPAIVIGAASSIGLLVAFFHPWLAVGVGIDLMLIWFALTQPELAGS